MLLKGHYSELDEAVASPTGFDEYVSKSNKKTYAGGKVERELEEVITNPVVERSVVLLLCNAQGTPQELEVGPRSSHTF